MGKNKMVDRLPDLPFFKCLLTLVWFARNQYEQVCKRRIK